MKKVLIIGYGNPGRADDGLGTAFAENIRNLNLDNTDIDSDYQLSLEHALDIANAHLTILADAHVSCQEPFIIKKVSPSNSFNFSTHNMSPENLTSIAEQISSNKKEVYILGIRGYEFNEFRESLSEKALDNLHKTYECFKSILELTKEDYIKVKLENMCKGQIYERC